MKLPLQALALLGTVGIYIILASSGFSGRGPNPDYAAYNLLARGLLSGHLYIAKDPPPSLTRISDPYDPEQNLEARFGMSSSPNGIHDFSYYRGRLYLYFGITPALVYFVPAHWLTGAWFPHWTAVAFFCTLGLIANVSLANNIRESCFPKYPERLAAIWAPLLGLASYAPMVLSRPDMWEIPIACAYFFVSLALLLLWRVFQNPQAAVPYLALASTALGAAFASRPTTLVVTPILAIALFLPQIRRNAVAWIAAIAPLAACGAAVAAYNFQRFESPFEFGSRYQLAGVYVSKLHLFSIHYVWANLELYLFHGIKWENWFPFVAELKVDSLPEGHGGLERVSGALLCVPALWAGVAVPLLLFRRRPDRNLVLAVLAIAWSAFGVLGLLAFFFGACGRYQLEFAPFLALLAVIGAMAMDEWFTGTIRKVVRGLWLCAVFVSCAFTILFGIRTIVTLHDEQGEVAFKQRAYFSAEEEFTIAHFFSPNDFVARLELARLLFLNGCRREGQADVQDLTRDFPENALARVIYGAMLEDQGHLTEAVEAYRQALAMSPDNTEIERQLRSAEARLANVH